jgi:cytoskeleton protein RodZ
MSDDTSDIPATPAPTTAGGLLRQARKAQGMHIAVLAAAMKVSPRKLELLESDQFDQLTDATFTRALAQTMCRALKIDAAPVLALMPRPPGHRLEQVSEGLNMPFRDRPDHLMPKEWASAAMPALVIAGLLLIGAAVIYLLPGDWVSQARNALAHGGSEPTAAASAPAADSVPEPVAAAASVSTTTAAAASAPVDVMPPTIAETSAPAAPLAAPAAAPAGVIGVLQLRPSAPSWVEVIDANGKPLIARLLQADESVGLDGALPMKVRIGNASATEVVFRGQPLELGPFTRDNLAKLELK